MKVYDLVKKIDERNDIRNIFCVDENDNVVADFKYIDIAYSGIKFLKQWSYVMNYTVKSFIVREMPYENYSTMAIYIK